MFSSPPSRTRHGAGCAYLLHPSIHPSIHPLISSPSLPPSLVQFLRLWIGTASASWGAVLCCACCIVVLVHPSTPHCLIHCPPSRPRRRDLLPCSGLLCSALPLISPHTTPHLIPDISHSHSILRCTPLITQMTTKTSLHNHPFVPARDQVYCIQPGRKSQSRPRHCPLLSLSLHCLPLGEYSAQIPTIQLVNSASLSPSPTSRSRRWNPAARGRPSATFQRPNQTGHVISIKQPP
ncbi:hypothetical protein DM02DRAFT_412081 [Periconia macrospinosa]|uniref:Uncharacterized protein n=1 Tax=Periconia macrospinosa TaxID=97972 RepID=A0A2V1CYE8_9PLEO|nr:hypothetical protein DM02DRAFT_412081 [Periconia macrospinosa]